MINLSTELLIRWCKLTPDIICLSYNPAWVESGWKKKAQPTIRHAKKRFYNWAFSFMTWHLLVGIDYRPALWNLSISRHSRPNKASAIFMATLMLLIIDDLLDAIATRCANKNSCQLTVQSGKHFFLPKWISLNKINYVMLSTWWDHVNIIFQFDFFGI